MTLQQILEAVSTLGTLGFALLAVYAFWRELVVPRSRLDEQRHEKREAIELQKQTVAAIDRLSDGVERALERLAAVERGRT